MRVVRPVRGVGEWVLEVIRVVRWHRIAWLDIIALLEFLAVVHVIVDVVEVGVVVVRLRLHQHLPPFAWHAQVNVPQALIHLLFGCLLRISAFSLFNTAFALALVRHN